MFISKPWVRQFFPPPALQLCCHLPVRYYWAMNTSGGIFLCQYSLSAGKKDCTSATDLSFFQLLHKFFESVDKVAGEGDIRTCSIYKRSTVGGIRRFIWSLKISQEGHCGCNPHFDYYISSKFQSSIPFKRWYVPSTWRCDSSPGMNWWLAISSVINKKSSVSLDVKTNQC